MPPKGTGADSSKGWINVTGQIIGVIVGVATVVSGIVSFVVAYFATKQDVCDVQYRLQVSSLPVSLRVYQMAIDVDTAALKDLQKRPNPNQVALQRIQDEIDDLRNLR